VVLTGIGDIPASGSASADIKVHVQEGGELYNILNVTKEEDLSYSESTTASGDITLFSKKTGYTSLLTGPSAVYFPL
jgi:hypothetical protein